MLLGVGTAVSTITATLHSTKGWPPCSKTRYKLLILGNYFVLNDNDNDDSY